MDRVKSVLASRTIITNFITFVASVAVLWGFNMTPEQQAGAVTLIVTLGTIVSSFFRVSATEQVVVATPKTAKSINETKVMGLMSRPTDASGMKEKDRNYTGLLVLLALLPLLGACISAGPTQVQVTPGVIPTKIDVAISRASEQVTQYCHVLTFAVGVGQMFVSNPTHLRYVQQAQAVVNEYCLRPPGDLQAAVGFLSRAYQVIMQVPEVRVEVQNAKLAVR